MLCVSFQFFFWKSLRSDVSHCAKSVHIRSFLVLIFPYSDWIRRDTEYLSVCRPNGGKYGPKNSKYRHSSRSVKHAHKKVCLISSHWGTHCCPLFCIWYWYLYMICCPLGILRSHRILIDLLRCSWSQILLV